MPRGGKTLQARAPYTSRTNEGEMLARSERASALQATLCRVGHRRTRCKSAAYLGEYAGNAFPVIKQRIRKLQQSGKHHKAQALAYAVEAEMAARRMARETRFPKTEGLAIRDARKASRMDELRPVYQKAYDRLRYVRRVGLPEVFAQLCVQRLLTQAWKVLLDMPPPAGGGVMCLPTIVADTQILFVNFADWRSSQTCPNRKQKEEDIARFLSESGVTCAREVTVRFGDDALYRRPQSARMDFKVCHSWGIDIVECDEHAHRHYEKGYDARRMLLLFAEIAKQCDDKVRFVRFNPDAYHLDGQQQCISQRDRQAALLKVLNSPPDQQFSVSYLFYDRTGALPDVCMDADYPSTLRAIASTGD